MRQARYGRVRGSVRLIGFVLRLLWAGAEMMVQRPRTLAERSAWRQRMSQLIARGLGLEIVVQGTLPAQGMLVSNHLSYLDAVVLGSLSPAVFVAKAEVRRWPLVGWLTAQGGTIYVDRTNARAAVAVNRDLMTALHEGNPVVVFPEGTTTGATDPLPFHGALFEAAVRRGAAVWPLALTYTIDGSSDGVAQDVCYWGDMTFVPHLMRLMRVRGLRAEVRVAREPVLAASRAEAALQSYAAVAAMLQDRSLRRVAGMQKSAAVQGVQHAFNGPVESLSA